TATPGRSATGRVDQPAGKEIDRSGWPRINDRHLARPAGRPDCRRGRSDGLLEHRKRRASNYCALGISMSLTGSELGRVSGNALLMAEKYKWEIAKLSHK